LLRTQTNVMIVLLGTTFACVLVRKRIVFLARETEIIYLKMQTGAIGNRQMKYECVTIVE